MRVDVQRSTCVLFLFFCLLFDVCHSYDVMQACALQSSSYLVTRNEQPLNGESGNNGWSTVD
jgi:hypothetical protein